ncbi:MAG: hypothetical protein AUI91_08545 [Acidobacteria bacterium 13_1_40CM_3_56_11]|nr:MAG: hypothetical protein AUI91_08545 [Acidobacteria bacterium 13_1_40CM_3_56_11]
MQTWRSDLAIYRRLFLQARPYWLHITGIFLLSLLDGPLGLVAPLPLKIAVDSGIGSQPLPRILDRILPANIAGSPSGILLFAAFLVVGVAALGGLLSLASTVLRSYTAEQLVLNFRKRVFAHLQRMSLRYHDAKGTADSVYRIQNDTVTLQYICMDSLTPFVTSVFTLAAMFYVTFRIDMELALVAMAIAPFLFLLSQKYRPLFRECSKEVKQIESSAMAVVHEVLSALRVVKAFGREQHEENRYVRRGTAGMWARIKLEFIGAAYSLVIGLLTAAGTAVVLWIGMRHVRAGELTLGSLLLVSSFFAGPFGRCRARLFGSGPGAGRTRATQRGFSERRVGLDQFPKCFFLI